MKGDMEGFMGGMPRNKTFGEADIKELFDAIQMYSQKNEEWQIDYKTHKEYIRDLYREGYLFKPGDVVESLVSGLVGEVHRCGANHVICVTEDGIMFKNFIYDIQHLNN